MLAERQGNPSLLVPAKPSPLDGRCLPCGSCTTSHIFIFLSAHPLMLLAICQCPREDGTLQENHQDTLIKTDAVEGLSSLKEASGLRQKGEVSADIAEMGPYPNHKNILDLNKKREKQNRNFLD